MMFKYAPEGFMYDNRWFPVTWGVEAPIQSAITARDIVEIAYRFKVPAAHVDAILQVEAGRSGFLLREPHPTRPKILFEGHYFYRLTPKPVSKTRPDLSYRRWTTRYYKGGSAEWGRLKDAFEFDPENALKSASWGLGQVMGANYEAAGCKSIGQFVAEAFRGERQQLVHMLCFIEHNELLDDLRAGNWDSVAYGYNGPSYSVNNYDYKLAQAAQHSEFA